MKKKILTIMAVVLCIFISICFVGCFNFNGDKNGGIENTVQPTFNCEYQSGLGYYVTVTGTLKNTSNKKYTYVGITFSCYDANGYNLGTCMDNMNYLGAGEEWQYKATSLGWFDKEAKTVKCSDITYM